jgi:hypothetical protein
MKLLTAGFAFAYIAICSRPLVAGQVSQATPTHTVATNDGGARDFDFLTGQWRVHHRTLKKTGASQEWIKFDGTAVTRGILGGQGNFEEQVMNHPTGTRYGVALRSFDPKTSQWSIWWLDRRVPLGPLDPPVRGSFREGVGTFYSDSLVDGKLIRTRYIWSNITATTCQWQQASSSDQGATWETNWVMNFERM